MKKEKSIKYKTLGIFIYKKKVFKIDIRKGKFKWR